MTWQGWLQIALFAALITAAVRPLGGYLARVIDGGCTPLQRVFSPLETALYRLAGVDPAEEQTWPAYAFGLLAFSLAGILMLYAQQRLQGVLPLNPQQFDAVSPDLALNTAVSFATNTSWQSYAGETTLSYLSQMAGITVQSFLSAAAGIAVAIALVRGFARHSMATIGNVWADLTRATLYVLLPICIVAGLFFVWHACRRRSAAMSTPPPWKACRNYWHAGRSLRRRRSSCCPVTAAAFSTPTRRIRSRTRPHSPGWSRCC